jgi:hypothetical protein
LINAMDIEATSMNELYSLDTIAGEVRASPSDGPPHYCYGRYSLLIERDELFFISVG